MKSWQHCPRHIISDVVETRLVEKKVTVFKVNNKLRKQFSCIYQLLIFETTKIKAQSNQFDLTLRNTNLKRVNNTKFLGVILEQNLR